MFQQVLPLLSSHQHHLVRAISSSTNVYIRRQACSSNVYRFISTCLIEHPPTALGDNRDKSFEFIFHQLQPREISRNLHLGEQRCAPISQQDHCHHMTVRNVWCGYFTYIYTHTYMYVCKYGYYT